MKQFFTLADLRDWNNRAREISPPIRLCVLGDPVAHSLSPEMQNAALRESNIDMQYALFQIAPDELEPAIRLMRELGFVGLNLTVPHKIAALPFVDEIEEQATKIGAINTIVFRENNRQAGIPTALVSPAQFARNSPSTCEICASSCLERVGERAARSLTNVRSRIASVLSLSIAPSKRRRHWRANSPTVLVVHACSDRKHASPRVAGMIQSYGPSWAARIWLSMRRRLD